MNRAPRLHLMHDVLNLVREAALRVCSEVGLHFRISFRVLAFFEIHVRQLNLDVVLLRRIKRSGFEEVLLGIVELPEPVVRDTHLKVKLPCGRGMARSLRQLGEARLEVFL